MRHPVNPVHRPPPVTWSICVVVATLALPGSRAIAAPNGNCSNSALNALRSCKHEVRADYWRALARCSNLADPDQRKECRKQARQDRDSAFDDCQAVFEARLELCGRLGEDPYDPVIDPADFVTTIDNPLLPLIPGTTFVYKTDDGVEIDTVEVTANTRIIFGVTCVEVHDVVLTNGELTEDTLDWFAQDKHGNVWYFGEHSEQLENGEIVGLEGSFETGVDGAKPGIVMRANPRIGDVYRQEFSISVAEDAAEVLSLGASVTVPYGSFSNCLQTGDFSPLEPDASEQKYYATGVGPVLTIDLVTGQRSELVSVTQG